MRIVSIPDSYRHPVAKVIPRGQEIQESVRQVLDSVSLVADHVVLYVSPVYTQGFTEKEIDTDFVDAYVGFAIDECRRHHRVTCLDLRDTFASEKSYYYNVTHLNGAGSEMLAHILAEHVKRLGEKSIANGG